MVMKIYFIQQEARVQFFWIKDTYRQECEDHEHWADPGGSPGERLCCKTEGVQATKQFILVRLLQAFHDNAESHLCH